MRLELPAPTRSASSPCVRPRRPRWRRRSTAPRHVQGRQPHQFG